MKIKIAVFFSILFISLLIVPTVVSLVDDTQDITFFLDINDEEENKGKKSKKEIETELKVQHPDSSLYILDGIQQSKNIRFYSKIYASEYPKISTPPPEFL